MMIDYSKVLSDKVVSMKPSGIRKFFDILNEVPGVISLTVGEPDFKTPWHVREAAIASLEKGRTAYTSNTGLLEFRKQISSYLERRFEISYDPASEMIITVGGSEAIDLAIRAIVEPGDEVLIVEPAYVCYVPMTELCGGVPVVIPTRVEDKFKLTPELLKKYITPKTKMLILPYPNNPTGAIMTEEDLKKIAEVIKDTNIVVLTDEIYGELTYGRKHCSFAAIPGMWDRTIYVGGFSKSYAMTGWRLGYVCAPEEITKQMLKIHQYAIMCAPTMSQYAGIEAVMNGDEDIEYMKDCYNQRRRMLLSGLNEIGLPCFEPEGAFYVFPEIGKFGLSSDEFCERLLYEEKCAIVPGNAFGASGEGFARISYAYSVEHISRAIDRIDKFLKKIK
ncbi:MAG: aminotransferase class I/II-fold pyridoxal phosphate-dependent enzyme [Ruminococcaceae bacterium]|nr:aminotransferase class I/II-fold pyridoxal phosphate-dependent enzyme [Oscillospiraceae bacterium]